MHSMQVATPRNRLLELRERRGLTLKDIADACNVYTSTVVHWQKGDIPNKHQGTVARLLDVSVPYLTGWSDVEEPFSNPKAA
jgi:transcriptional regulator with XRE-family HTH domain